MLMTLSEEYHNRTEGGLLALLGWHLSALAPVANHPCQNRYALLTLGDVAAKLITCAESGNACFVQTKSSDGKDVAERVVVKSGQCAEVGGYRLALALLKPLDERLAVWLRSCEQSRVRLNSSFPARDSRSRPVDRYPLTWVSIITEQGCSASRSARPAKYAVQ